MDVLFDGNILESIFHLNTPFLARKVFVKSNGMLTLRLNTTPLEFHR